MITVGLLRLAAAGEERHALKQNEATRGKRLAACQSDLTKHFTLHMRSCARKINTSISIISECLAKGYPVCKYRGMEGGPRAPRNLFHESSLEDSLETHFITGFSLQRV